MTSCTLTDQELDRWGHLPVDYKTLLSPREWEVMQLVVQGLSNREIGDKLSLSHTTIATHIRGLLNKFTTEKIRVSNRVQIAVLAMRNGLAEEFHEG